MKYVATNGDSLVYEQDGKTYVSHRGKVTEVQSLQALLKFGEWWEPTQADIDRLAPASLPKT